METVKTWIVVIMLFAQVSFAFADPERRAVAAIKAIGGSVATSGDGAVSGVFLRRKRPIGMFTDADIASVDFGALINATHLSLSGDEITDQSLARVASIPRLSSLHLMTGKTTGKGLARFLDRHTSLFDLTVRDTPVSDDTFQAMVKLNNLHFLTLSKMEVTDKDLKTISNIRDLVSVDVSYSKVTDEGLIEIARLNKLRSLDVSGTNVSDKGVLRLATLKGLRRLKVTSTKVTEQGKSVIRLAIPGLVIN